MTAAPARGEATAERILDAAFRSIASRGCGAVTLRGIAEEAGVVLSQLNYYHGNKANLFAAVLRRMKQDYAEGLDRALARDAPGYDPIRTLVEYNEAILRDSPDTYRNFLEFFNFAMNAESFRIEVATFISDIAQMIESRIAGHDGANIGREAFSPAVITRFILSASFGISLQHLLSPGDPEVQAGFAVVKQAAGRLLAPAPPPSAA